MLIILAKVLIQFHFEIVQIKKCKYENNWNIYQESVLKSECNLRPCKNSIISNQATQNVCGSVQCSIVTTLKCVTTYYSQLQLFLSEQMRCTYTTNVFNRDGDSRVSLTSLSNSNLRLNRFILNIRLLY